MIVLLDFSQVGGVVRPKSGTHGKVIVSGIRGDLALTTHNGSVEVSDCEGRLAARTHNGSVGADVVAGEFELRTHNGSIRFDNGAVGEVSGRLVTHNGNVRLRLLPEARASFDGQTRNGSISVPQRVVVVSKDRRRLRGIQYGATHGGEGTAEPTPAAAQSDILDLVSGEVEIKTHNGSITIE